MASLNLRGRLMSHAEKVRKSEEMEAVLAGVFSQEAQIARDKFESVVKEIVKPAFEEFKATLREMDRDAVIISNLSHHPVQSIGLTLVDRYLKLGTGHTLKLINPKEDIAKGPNTKFYEVYQTDDILYVRQRAEPQASPVITALTYKELTPKFLENELASFFERAYPAKD